MSQMQIIDEELIHQVRHVIARTLGKPLDSIGPRTGQGEFEEWDSLGQLNIIMELEGEFGTSFSMDQVLQMRSVGDIVTVVKDHFNGG